MAIALQDLNQQAIAGMIAFTAFAVSLIYCVILRNQKRNLEVGISQKESRIARLERDLFDAQRLLEREIISRHDRQRRETREVQFGTPVAGFMSLDESDWVNASHVIHSGSSDSYLTTSDRERLMEMQKDLFRSKGEIKKEKPESFFD